MPTKDFACDHCGELYRDHFYTGRCPEKIKCSCGKMATWTRQRPNYIHMSKGTLYGRFDPQFGCVVEDYSHKRRLLKQMGLEEAGRFSQEQIREESWEAEEADKKARKSDSGVLAADSLDEINAQIEKQTTKARKGDLQESWVSI